ncbi:hypothetical protein TTHT_1713 [Thermotomaculum hydrothermale]|uniref:DUF4352 domain-containing protein n=1 Tax=Thermotomaculum hydrothermale TaxID=981385 RepID=A0A7R6PYH8_9BACT|nr:hypothetical protein [Thermotomaculum hydrothermale]BBB33185.1 hypothetical protein TTHT_1713 [Thermotomaculum hydrothermale]
MKKILFLVLIFLIIPTISCKKENPLEELISARSKYIVKTLGFNLVRDENGDPAYLNVEFAIENKNPKPVLKYLTLKVIRYDVKDNIVGKDTIVVDVSDLGGYKLKRYLRKIPNKIRGVRSILVKKAPVNLENKEYLKYKEFQAFANR